jgi:hypothetical protein
MRRYLPFLLLLVTAAGCPKQAPKQPLTPPETPPEQPVPEPIPQPGPDNPLPKPQ